MDGAAGTVAEATASAVETAVAVVQNAEASSAAVIEAAAERVEQAQQTAEDIARAAIESDLGRQIATLREENLKWQADAAEIRASLQSLGQQLTAHQTELAEIRTQMSSLVVAIPAPASLTPPGLTEPVPPAVPMVTPVTTLQNVAEESPAVATRPKRRWI